MLWYKMDSNAMEGRTFKRVARRLGNAGVGALVRLYCFSAGHGKDPTSPGRCVDSDLEPIPREDLVEASGLSEEDFDALIETCVSTKCVDGAWADRGELNFPGMLSRCDEYAAKVMRRLASEARTKGWRVPGVRRRPAGWRSASLSAMRAAVTGGEAMRRPVGNDEEENRETT